MVSVRKRGKYFQARVTFKDPITGVFRTKNKSGFLRARDARTWAERWHFGLEQPKESDRLLSDYFENWFKTYKTNRSSQTILQYQNTLSTIKRFLPNATLQTFDRDQFQAFLNEYGKNHSKETMQKRKSQIASSLKDAVADGKIKTDPTHRLNLVYDPNKAHDKKLKFLEKSEVNKLLNYCEQDLTLNNFLIITALYSGARFGELRALTKEDIKKPDIIISKAIDGLTGKTKNTKNVQSNRKINMPDSWFEMYQSYQPKQDRLFEISSNGINKYLKSLCKKLEIKQITFHALRHTHASILLANGISMLTVSERLGHANLTITEKVYSHLLESQRSKDEDKINNIF